MNKLIEYWPIALFLINAITTGVAWSLRKLAQTEVKAMVDASHAQLAAEDRRIEEITAGHGKRVTVLEEGVKNLPTKDDLARVMAAIAAIGQAQSAQGAKLDAVKEAGKSTQDSVDRLYRYFLEEGE